MRLKIKRYDGQRSYWQEFELEGEGRTLLELLTEVKEKHDPSLSFRAFCRSGICGTCGVKVNGVHRLACRTRLYGDATVEPPDYGKLIKDLVVEHEFLAEYLKKGRVWLHPREVNLPLKPSDLKPLERSYDCILCGLCNFVCPLTPTEPSFGLPSTFTKGYAKVKDKRNAKPEENLRALARLNPQLCTHCRSCSLV
ncbi:MAG: succinate dehydrogenase/fumarate reductase iron-sulfur subunit, partial [Aquificae bacterium]|nr:succinate dehydrogenase/fumarate reductase iron-sulfur subunit [Aquificota bacterium]